ncbi:ArsA family ATPase [Candidatus Nitrosocosmicus franklandus]|uniref:Arsenical pump-driving ATPase n=1 Tax=Candidatus Nitrosocosmicus franklandianus TaxID=1798806 RepID=A0A484IEK4_9ARCH|nr:ArsA family ATPase [Candidatus Nitrosocosmicus franklandus]VFJ14429.1 Arsenical pump-driving ATPase [Candidatus Nitrosocosmicus franklandus]
MRLIIYTGKGGTGKTVNSCSTAIKLADLNYKTLVISADPAHTLKDAFMVPVVGNKPIKILDNLYALQVDPVLELAENYGSVLSYVASIFSKRGLDETLSYEIAMLPGMTQLFSLLKIEEFMRHESFDCIVMDMPASGEALRYLYFPKLVGNIGEKFSGFTGVFSGFVKMFQPFSSFAPIPTDVIQIEMNLLKRLEILSKILTDTKITSLRLLINPDSFSIENAKRALMSTNLYGMNVDAVIINKIFPRQVPDSYFTKWTEYQSTKIEEAKTSFYPLYIIEERFYEKELKGIEMLRENAETIFANKDPSRVFYSDKVFEFVKDGPTLILKIKAPFTNKDNFDVNRYGDYLVIKILDTTGNNIVNVIPLPIATITMKLYEVKIREGIIEVTFRE